MKDINVSRKWAYVLESSYKIKGRKSYVSLLCLAKTIFELYARYDPYFYINANNMTDKNVQKLKSELLELTDAGIGVVTKIDTVKKNVLGKPTNLLKVVCTTPSIIPKLQSYLSEYQCFEYKIPFALRYLLDNQIEPLSLVKYERSGRLIKKILDKKEHSLPKLKVVCFDIEVYSKGLPSPTGHDPIIMISISKNGKSKVLTYREVDKKNAVVLSDEKEMLLKFFDEIKNAHILTGYNTSAFDIPYIIKRCKVLGIDPVFVNGVPQVKKHGMITYAHVPGVVHIDLFPMVKFFDRIGAISVSRYTLGQVYKDLFSVGETTKEIMEDGNFIGAWDDDKKRNMLFEYSLGDADMTYKIFEYVFPLMVELARASKASLFDVSVASSSKLVERLLMYESIKCNDVIPPIPNVNAISERMKNPIAGAYVKLPEPGIYEDIVVFDFSSLYPTIIVSHNIDPATVNNECDEYYESPVGHKFCKKQKGLIPTVLKKLIQTRLKLKSELKKYDRNSKKYKELFPKVQALKILANSFYGYLGYPRSRWYSRECAESVTAWARHYIKWVMEEAEKYGFKVIYGDTDSTFLLLGDKKISDATKFLKYINSKLPGMMELGFEDYYPRGIFVSKKNTGGKGAKKKYALINKKGYIKIRGFELVRRDWSSIARKTQKKVLEIILSEGDKRKAVNYVRKVIENLKNNKIPVKDTAIRTVIRKRLDKYDVTSPETSAALKGVERGEKITSGAMIDYVITKGSGSISERAELLKYAENYDPDYYVNNQILPAVLKILKELGVTKDELLGRGKQQSLSGFFG
ncbi:hypothetical protein J7J90_01760 [Candidatus Micrarchaeota archaeon]|nr:hypothetical protein [Candidatus Micrarchaeota archaeon]